MRREEILPWFERLEEKTGELTIRTDEEGHSYYGYRRHTCVDCTGILGYPYSLSRVARHPRFVAAT